MRVEVSGGLVGEHDLGSAGERARDRDALLLTSGQLRRAVFQARAQPDDVDDVVEPCLVGIATGERERKRDVLHRGERGDEVVGLEHETDAIAPDLRELLVGERAELDVAEEHLAARERVEPGDAVQQCGLPRARRPHDRRVRAALEGDVDAVERAHFGVGFGFAVHLRRVDGARRPRW